DVLSRCRLCSCFFFQAEDGIRDRNVTGVQTCALPIWGVDHVELRDHPLWHADGEGNEVLALEFVGGVIGEAGAVLQGPMAFARAGHEREGVEQRGLAARAVADDGHVADFSCLVDAHARLGPGGRKYADTGNRRLGDQDDRDSATPPALRSRSPATPPRSITAPAKKNVVRCPRPSYAQPATSGPKERPRAAKACAAPRIVPCSVGSA